MSARTEGLSAAGEVLARWMRLVAVVKTRRTADAVNVSVGQIEAVIAAGHPEGVYGWEPIQALMFDNNKRHPLFGNKRRWYHQGYYPITEDTIRLGTDEAVEAYADAAVDLMLKEHGILK